MPRNTLLALTSLSVIASLLIGIQIGKKLGITQYVEIPQQTPVSIPSPSAALIPTVADASRSAIPGRSTYTDSTCGFTFSYQGEYLRQITQDSNTTIVTNPDDPNKTLVSTCQQEIPRPPLPPELIEDIVLDGIPAKLYHDASSKDGTPRDEVIVRHPTKDHDIFIAGFGDHFDQAVVSFRFLP